MSLILYSRGDCVRETAFPDCVADIVPRDKYVVLVELFVDGKTIDVERSKTRLMTMLMW